MIHRRLYVSRVAAAHLPSVVEDILRVSVANNSRDGITGFLVCDGVSFMQGLEGDEGVVAACFARIVADRQHTDIVLRDDTPAASRRFGGWSMCGLYLSQMDDALLAETDIDFDIRHAAPDALWQQLASLGSRHADALNAEHARRLAAVR